MIQVKSESGKLVMGWMHSARTGADDSCTPDHFQTRCIWPKPGQAIQIRSRLVLLNMIRAFRTESDVGNLNWHIYIYIDLYIYIWYDPAQFWLHMGGNGHNQNTSEWIWHVYRDYIMYMALTTTTEVPSDAYNANEISHCNLGSKVISTHM